VEVNVIRVTAEPPKFPSCNFSMLSEQRTHKIPSINMFTAIIMVSASMYGLSSS
jgi:hypothetical protein